MASILVVDDEIDLRELVRKMLVAKGHDVVTAPRIDEALEWIARRPFDLVILDAHIRGELAVPFIRSVRSAKNSIPVIVYSGFVTPEEEKEFLSAGASAVVLKGAGVSLLAEKIGSLFFAPPPSSAARPAPRTVLVVDDDAAVRRVLRRFLESRHFTVLEAEGGAPAVEVVRSKEPLTAVLLDVNMPGQMGGIETLQEIRFIRPELGVIMVSGEQDDHTVGRAVELGAAGYVVKPFDFLYLEMLLLSRISDPRRPGA